MSNGNKPVQEGYQPQGQRGYQPQVNTPNIPEPQGGYTPTTGQGGNPPSSPQPPDGE